MVSVGPIIFTNMHRITAILTMCTNAQRHVKTQQKMQYTAASEPSVTFCISGHSQGQGKFK